MTPVVQAGTPRAPLPLTPRGASILASLPEGEEVGALLDDRFELRERLGDGGMAVVFAARDRVLRNRAAVKVSKFRDPELVRRFKDEVEILSNLQHPHLVNVRAAGETVNGIAYMALEYLPGETIEQRLKRGPLPWREALEVGVQVASALDALHRAGIIHRDVKPSNIIIVEDTASEIVVKLIDLGVAKVDDEAWQRAKGSVFTPLPPRRPTDTGRAIGTPGFIPLEAGLARPDPRFDVYALGATLYLMCTGRMWDLDDQRSMNERRPGCEAPADLEEVVAAALSLEPEDRIASAAELQRRLEAIRAAHTGPEARACFDGCYELLEVLGVGGKAQVYRAYHLGAARYTAIKLLSNTSRASAEERTRFEHEARALAAVDHPAIPRLFEYRAGERPYLSMGLAAGVPAGRFCSAATRLSSELVIEIGRQLVRAVSALHQRGILHRDLHASNVLIDFKREPVVMLIDLGMCELTSRFYAGNLRYPTPPDGRQRLGNGGLEQFEWTAPEARAGAGWTEKSDVYSLGLLLYRLLTGRKPTRGDPKALISPLDAVPDCSEDLADALLVALHHDPNERLDLAQLGERLELAAEVEAAVGGSEVRAVVREERVPETVVVAAAPTGREHVPQELGRVEPPRVRRAWWGLAGAVAASLTLGSSITYLLTRPGEPDSRGTAMQDDAQPPVEPSKLPASTLQTPALPTPVLPMEAALRGVEDALRACARREQRPLSIEFKVDDAGRRFASTELLTPVSDKTTACVRSALDDLTFLPTSAQIFNEEFAP